METLETAVTRSVEGLAGTVYLAVSGGRDSMVLLEVAASCLPKERLCVLHVNHGLQSGSEAWADFVRRESDRLGVEFLLHEPIIASGSGMEAAARAARYAWFASLLNDGDVLLTAHHQRDQAETVLLRLAQGRGAYGMPDERPLGAGVLCRPFLDVPAEVLTTRRVSFIEDPSNADTDIDRNFVRHRLMPPMTERWPEVSGRLATVARSEAAKESAGRHLLANVDPLPVSLLPGEPAAAGEVLRWWLLRFGISASISSLSAWLAAEPRKRCDLQGGALIEHAEAIYFARLLLDRYALPDDGQLLLPHGHLSVLPASRATVRFGAAGLRWQGEPLGEVLRRLGVAAWLRDRVPLIFQHDQLMAVADFLATEGLHVRWRSFDASGNFLPAG